MGLNQSLRVGERFGKLSVVELKTRCGKKNRRLRPHYICQCDCGGSIAVSRHRLMVGSVSDCGCIDPLVNTRYDFCEGLHIALYLLQLMNKEVDIDPMPQIG